MFVSVPPSFSVRRIQCRAPSISYQFKCDNQRHLNLSGSLLRPGQRFHFQNGRQAQKEEKSKNDVCFGQGLSSVSVNKYLCTRRDKLATDKNETLGEAAKVRKEGKNGKMLNETFLYSFPFPDLRRRSAAFPDRFRWHRDVASSRNSCSVCVSVSVVCVCV
jgi:hypothetical protein